MKQGNIILYILIPFYVTEVVFMGFPISIPSKPIHILISLKTIPTNKTAPKSLIINSSSFPSPTKLTGARFSTYFKRRAPCLNILAFLFVVVGFANLIATNAFFFFLCVLFFKDLFEIKKF